MEKEEYEEEEKKKEEEEEEEERGSVARKGNYIKWKNMN